MPGQVTAGWANCPRWLWSAVLVAASAAGCADGYPEKRYFASCAADSECASGTCFQGSCSKPCVASAECDGGVCVTNYCVPAAQACSDMDSCTTDSLGADGACVHTPLAAPGCAVVKRVFLASGAYTANLGGLQGADALCQQLSSKLALPGTFKAWLSSTQASPADRFSAAARGPATRYVLVDGTVVAEGWGELTAKPLRHPIDLTELGKPHPGGTNGCKGTGEPSVWTATQANGTADPDRVAKGCADWTTASLAQNAQAIWGKAATTDGWTTNATCNNFGANTCNRKAALYCFEQ